MARQGGEGARATGLGGLCCQVLQGWAVHMSCRMALVPFPCRGRQRPCHKSVAASHDNPTPCALLSPFAILPLGHRGNACAEEAAVSGAAAASSEVAQAEATPAPGSSEPEWEAPFLDLEYQLQVPPGFTSIQTQPVRALDGGWPVCPGAGAGGAPRHHTAWGRGTLG